VSFRSLKRLITGLLYHRTEPVKSNRELMRSLEHQFSNPSLLQHALTHRSALSETGSTYAQSNELLEFLGDAVLALVVVEHLYRSFPDRHEGELSKIKSMLVSGKALHQTATDLELGKYILMSDNEARNGGRNRGSILEDTFEAVIAALYLDGGIEAARKFINKRILFDIDELIDSDYDINFKSQLLEYAQGMAIATPVYKVIAENGPDHKKKFEIEVRLEGRRLGIGSGRTKKSAQQRAARAAIEQLTANGTGV